MYQNTVLNKKEETEGPNVAYLEELNSKSRIFADPKVLKPKHNRENLSKNYQKHSNIIL